MSIKYLGDNQLNQIQNNPNDTPWAKLIAQSEMLERSKMRQPQGQYPQGTVASAIQQQLLNEQMQQANQVQGLDAEKARVLAQLINSGQLQGMADGGLTPSMSNPQLAPMLGASPIKPQVAQTQLAPTKEAIDQQPHHDIFQRLLDNSIIGVAQGKGSIGDSLQMYADLFTGKALKGLADGGEVRRYDEGGFLSGRNYVGSQRKSPSFLDALGGGLEPLFPEQPVAPNQAAPAQEVDYSALEALRRKQRGESPTPVPRISEAALQPLVELKQKIGAVLPSAENINAYKDFASGMIPSAENIDAYKRQVFEGKPAAPTAPASQPTAAPTTQTQAVTKQPVTRDNAKQIAQVHGYEKQDSELLNKAQQLGALAQTEDAVTQTAGDNIVDMLHKRLKDADVDYMELAKRISENEKDLAQERKDGTLTAVLTGVGAALSRAGTLEQKGDRVFNPGIGQILGAGILGGIESSEATDKKYRTGIEKNLEALNALQGLKRATANDLMDAYTAEKQNAVMAQHYKSIEDIAQQKLQPEIAHMNAQTGMYNAQTGMFNAKAGTETTGGGKPLTQAQKLIASRAAFTQAQKVLANDPNFNLKSQDEQLDAINELAQTILATQIGNATGNAVAAPQPTTAAALPGFNLLSSRPAK